VDFLFDSLKRIFYDEGHVILVLEGIMSDLRTRMTYWPEEFQDQKKIKVRQFHSFIVIHF